MAVLVTGGAGYIGSHISVELLNNNREVIIIDNLMNSNEEVIKNIEKIANKKIKFYSLNMINEEELEKVFKENEIESVIHLAGLKAVGESVKKPLEYYYNNLVITLNLLRLMKKYNCKKFVFSSSATVYGQPKTVPIKEEFP